MSEVLSIWLFLHNKFIMVMSEVSIGACRPGHTRAYSGIAWVILNHVYSYHEDWM